MELAEEEEAARREEEEERARRAAAEEAEAARAAEEEEARLEAEHVREYGCTRAERAEREKAAAEAAAAEAAEAERRRKLEKEQAKMKSLASRFKFGATQKQVRLHRACCSSHALSLISSRDPDSPQVRERRGGAGRAVGLMGQVQLMKFAGDLAGRGAEADSDDDDDEEEDDMLDPALDLLARARGGGGGDGGVPRGRRRGVAARPSVIHTAIEAFQEAGDQRAAREQEDGDRHGTVETLQETPEEWMIQGEPMTLADMPWPMPISSNRPSST